MDVFSIHEQVIADYRDFTAGFLSARDERMAIQSFSVLRKYEERDHGEFVTKRLVLTEYDRMAGAASSGQPYRSTLTPERGSGSRHAARVGA